MWPPFPGGAERLIFNVARDLFRRGFDVTAVTGYHAALRYDGPPVAALPIGIRDDHVAGAEVLASMIAELDPELILTHHFYAHEFRSELVASGIPLVQVVLNGTRIPEAALAVYISQWVRDTGRDEQPNDLVLTPPAFDDVVASVHGDAIGFIKPLPHKGVDLVYRIAELLPDRRFVVLRGEWQTLETIIERPNVEFMEPVVDIRDFYARVRLMLMPSVSEDAGTVAQEAALNRIPCLSTAVGGLAETNAGGVLLPVDDSAAWVDAIVDLDDPSRYAETVARQAAYLAAADHAGTLDVLATRIAMHELPF